VVEAIGPSDDRAEALAPQIDRILAESGAPKVHLLGHSQGGLDIRVLVSGLGYADRAATMTTLATPHRGIRIELPDWLTGQDFTESYMTDEFDVTYPDIETIPRYSWTGESCPILDIVCHGRTGGEVVDPLFALTIRLVQDAHGDDPFEGANDGLVPIASARWGEFLGILYADHMDEVGQLADDPDEGPFDHIEFFLSEARRLRQVELDLVL
jgi:triacylglycerol lipase